MRFTFINDGAMANTSSQKEQVIANFYRRGCNSYIRKPVDFAKFSEALQSMSMYRLILNEPPLMEGAMR